MLAVIKSAAPCGYMRSFRAEWVLVFLGLTTLYVPTYFSLAGTIWQSEAQAHGPIILAVFIWLLWKNRDAISGAAARPVPVRGWALFVFGLLLYAVGRSQDILIFEVGSQIPVIAGTLLILRGASAVRAAWFPLLYVVFMIPLPGVVVDALTGPLKQWVSVIAAGILHGLGYPIARNGVVLTVGQYQLLVADACSGLNSMYSLSALGALYLYVVKHRSTLRNLFLLAAVLPIAFAANVVRVVLLVFITYHFGDEAGQGFVHEWAGMILFIAALLLLVAADRAVGVLAQFARRCMPRIAS